MKLFDFLVDFVFPNRCGFCDSFIEWDKFACDDCINKIESANSFIRQDDNGNFKLCISAVYYDGVAKDGILNLKHPEGINTAKFFVPMLCDNLEKTELCGKIDLVTAVPACRGLFSERKYNHAEIIARLVAKQLGISRNYRILGRHKSEEAQHELSRSERVRAVKDLYFLKNRIPDIKGKTILLCDDIITTGSTLSECSRLLLEAGAREVYACTLATTKDKNEM